jgi:hypothetical protein
MFAIYEKPSSQFFWGRRFEGTGMEARPQFLGRATRRSQKGSASTHSGYKFRDVGGDALTHKT